MTTLAYLQLGVSDCQFKFCHWQWIRSVILLGLICFYLVLHIFTWSYLVLLVFIGLTRFYLVLLVFTTYLSAWALTCLWRTYLRLDILLSLHALIDQFTK